MSRSKPAGEGNPATRHFEWKGGDGHVEYYDKDLKKKVTVDLPFRMIVLDQLATVVGYNDDMKEGITSNEVRSTKRDGLRVRFFKKGTIAEGLWEHIKPVVKSKGGKYATSVYIAYVDEDGELKLGRFIASGSSLSPWIEFNKGNREAIGKMAVVLNKGGTEKKGTNTYFVPAFSVEDISEEEDDMAKDLDVKLQAYLSGYLTRAEPEDQTSGHDAADDNQGDPDWD